MVISWLWQLVTFSDLHDPENQDGFNFFMKEEEIIYRILTDLLVKHAEKFLRTPVHSIVSDRLLIKYCKVFNVNAPFREKEFLLKLVIKQLDKCDKFEQNINALFYAFGIANSYALLKIMKELSAIDVSRVWTAILSYDGRDTRI